MVVVQKRKIWNLVISSVIVLLPGNVQTVLASSVRSGWLGGLVRDVEGRKRSRTAFL